jgi:hypothetical protein
MAVRQHLRGLEVQDHLEFVGSAAFAPRRMRST